MHLNVRDSYTARVLLGGAKRLRVALATATVTTWLSTTSETIAVAVRNSTPVRAARGAKPAVQNSWIYRWLTAEPDPDVVVIDLRETMIVGPILRLLDWLLGPLVANWGQSRWGRLADRLRDALLAQPVVIASTVVLAAVAANLLVMLARGSPSSSALGLRFLVASIAIAGTRITGSVEELTQTRTYEVLVALLEPPEPPDEER